MEAERSASGRTQPIADRLAVARESGFIGRRDELALFRSALAAAEPPFTVLHVHGPGGVGKTCLLREFARLAREGGRPLLRLDAHDIAPTPQAFLAAFADAQAGAGLPHDAVPADAVILIDTYEAVSALDAWLRETILPAWPAKVLVVIAGREAPPAAWATDIAWSTLARALPLANLEPAEAAALLSARGIDADAHGPILEFTRGHPLALALVADLLRQRADPGAFDPLAAPDVVHHLSSLFLERVPDAEQREALDVCALARVTGEPLLVALFGRERGLAAFAWLRGRPFVESGPRGLFPHDLVREVVIADARWRDADALVRLSRRVNTVLHAQIAGVTGAERQRLQMDSLYVTRVRPTNAAFFDWSGLDERRVEPARAADEGWILDLVARHEGPPSADIARVWWGAQRPAFQVLWGPGDARLGFLALLDVGDPMPSEPDDPAIAAARAFVDAHGPTARGEAVVYLRWWMDAEAYQAVTPAINLTALHVVSHCMTRPGIAWNFVAMADPGFWAAHFDGVNFPRAPDADFEVAGRRHGVFAHDWRVEPPADWVMGVRTPMPFAAPREPPGAASGLGPDEFHTAVRQALRDYARPEALASGPLRSARLLRAVPDPQARAAALRGLLRAAVEELRAHPRDARLHRALWHTYIEPLPTQERVAERLGLPFSTYRHHLVRGIERVARSLWLRERALPPA